MRRFGRLGAAALAAAVAMTLLASDPAKPSYAAWAAAQPEFQVHEPVIGRLSGAVGSAVIALSTRRVDCGLFSLYLTRIGQEGFTTLGVAGRFVLLNPLALPGWLSPQRLPSGLDLPHHAVHAVLHLVEDHYQQLADAVRHAVGHDLGHP